MTLRAVLITIGMCVGLFFGYIFFFKPPMTFINPLGAPAQSKEVVGFLPYWELGSAKEDYATNLTTLSYFSLTIDDDGTIKKLNSPTENEPGWNDLKTGQVDPFLNAASKNKAKLSLVVFNGNVDAINHIITDPEVHAANLVNDVKPIMQQYKFTDLTVDIEYISTASPAARAQFVDFITTVKKRLSSDSTLTVAISPADFIREQLVDYKKVGAIADKVVLMGYDYHAPDSYVTGPNAPMYGAGVDSEYDVKTLTDIAAQNISPSKLLLGIPLYGYEWETIEKNPRAAVLPGTGVIASNNRAEKYLAGCTNCESSFDEHAQESYLVYKDDETGTFHQMYYPDAKSTAMKITLVQEKKLGGIALWALGYEGKTILDPITSYLK